MEFGEMFFFFWFNVKSLVDCRKLGKLRYKIRYF